MTQPAADSPVNPAADNIRTIVELEHSSVRDKTRSERISDRISAFVGSLTFVAVQVLFLAAWMGWNAAAPQAQRFDPYPYGLLTFIVSLEGVLIATFVLIAQNRMAQQSDRRDHLNLQVDLLAEQEMTLMLRMLRRISDHLGVGPETQEAARAEKLAEETNVYELMETLKRELPETHRPK